MARKPQPASQWIKLTEHGIEFKPLQALDFDIASVEFDRLKDLDPVPEIDIPLPGLPEGNTGRRKAARCGARRKRDGPALRCQGQSKTAAANSTAA